MASMLEGTPDLKALRRQHGISQQRLAEITRCSLSMIRILESGYQPERSKVLPRALAAISTLNENDPAGNRAVQKGERGTARHPV